ncbi:MAG: glycoside hydrolase family 3 protein, partial [Armatimonadetes bacterium]|nr:glycoside hydrolase family 3 protein [Anaerolineae bacterium]
MTLAEKIGQMTQVEKNSITPSDIATYFIGSVLSGGGGNPTPNNAQAWADMVGSYQTAALTTRLRIPLLYGVDAVHGHNNLYGAVIYPHNIGLGATRDPVLVQHIAQMTARELLATGVHWNFAPAVSVPQDIRWGRVYEGFSEATAIVTELSTAYLHGLQQPEARVLASIKHFVGDGGTRWQSTRTYPWMHGNWQAPGSSYSIDQGDNQDDEATLRAIHLAPYQAAIDAGARNIMVSFSSWHGTKLHAHRALLTDVLKGEMGFAGFLVSDWMALNQIDEDYATCVITSINAGLDMVMVPFDYKQFITTLTNAVENGDVPIQRIDDAVRRILGAKFWLGLFDAPFGKPELLPEIGSAAHRAVAREAVRKSLVLLKNEGAALPLSKTARLLVAGNGADNLGIQCGGWSIAWQGDDGAITEGTSILQAIQNTVIDATQVIYSVDATFTEAERAAVGVVVVGETPYAEGLGDNAHLTLTPHDLAIIHKMRPHCEKLVVILLS